MYEVFYFYSIFIYGEKPHFTVMKTENGLRVSTTVCGKLIVCWGENPDEMVDKLSAKAVQIIKDDQRPYDYFEQQVWDIL